MFLFVVARQTALKIHLYMRKADDGSIKYILRIWFRFRIHEERSITFKLIDGALAVQTRRNHTRMQFASLIESITYSKKNK